MRFHSKPYYIECNRRMIALGCQSHIIFKKRIVFSFCFICPKIKTWNGTKSTIMLTESEKTGFYLEVYNATIEREREEKNRAIIVHHWKNQWLCQNHEFTYVFVLNIEFETKQNKNNENKKIKQLNIYKINIEIISRM